MKKIKEYCTDKRTQRCQFQGRVSDQIKNAQEAEEDKIFEGCADAVWNALERNALEQYIQELATEQDKEPFKTENEGKKYQRFLPPQKFAIDSLLLRKKEERWTTLLINI